MISNSGHDENKKYKGGVAGDQTGQEWAVIPWYNRPQNVVLRYPDIKVGLKIAELAKKAANNNYIGYDQNQRTTYWTQLSKVGYDPSKITTPCEADCTAGVAANIKAVGNLMGITKLMNVSKDLYSGNMRSALVSAGFQALTDSKYLTSDAYLLPGDVLLYENHHAATNLDYGSKVNYTMANGWVKFDNKWMYYENNTLVTNKWIKVANKWYKVDGLGYMITGWYKEVKNGETIWYQLDPVSGIMYADTWLKIDGKWYYFGKDGKAYSQKWLKWKAKWYYFGSDCSMKTSSWIKWTDNHYYYVDKEGVMATDCYIKDKNKEVWYHVDGDGIWDDKTVTVCPVGAVIVY